MRTAAAASRDGGVSPPRQLLELIRLRAGPGKLAPEDYYRMRVYRCDRSFADKRGYLSPQAFGAIHRDRRWGLIADDKLLTYAVLLAQGLPVPEVRAILHPVRNFAGAAALRSPEALSAYLTTEAQYPFYAKPIQGIYSKDGMLVRSLDSAGGTILLGDGSEMPLPAFLHHCGKNPRGFLFQELLHPHPAMAEICGDRLCTLRMIVLLDHQGPRLFTALWKIAVPGNMADNYWRKGNMLALLDKEHGTVLRCTTGLGPELRVVERHPASGLPLAGFSLPDWSDAVDLTLRAASAFPGLPVQAWDIALTSRGALPLEVNVFGSPFLPQIANDAGMLQGEFRAFIGAQKG
ncbi:MAG: sugar-transfer associated ATP-grasp domain-containing protein [Kiloniellaceae bacterium]